MKILDIEVLYLFKDKKILKKYYKKHQLNSV